MKPSMIVLSLVGLLAGIAFAEGGNMTFQLKSSAFQEGKLIPKVHTCDGPDQSPPLHWENAPAGTKSFALIVDDPDAPGRIWVHWVLYNLPAKISALQPGFPGEADLGDGTKQGKNDSYKIGYAGPCPPDGTHRYYFKLYALDSMLPLPAGATKVQLESAMKGHVLAEAQLMGTYRR